jgi:NAD(P)-dependent dehydrogenase (short-subunit alcohol dehydrogenase family)
MLSSAGQRGERRILRRESALDLGLAQCCAIVAGSSQGIGLAIARVLASEGADVVLCVRTPESLAAATRELRDLPGCVTSTCADLATPAGAVDVRDTALKAFARIDVLVNNAGVYDVLAFEDVDDAGWERLFTLNLMAAVRLSQLIVPLMRA